MQRGALTAGAAGLLAGENLAKAGAPTARANLRVNVQDLGVQAGEGDNTAAIQKAIDQLSVEGGAILEFPAGMYRCGGLVLKPHVSLSGLRMRSMLYAVDSAPIITIPTGTNQVDLVGLSFRGSPTATNGIGVVVNGIGNRLAFCDFQEFSDEGLILAQGGLVHHLEYIFADNCLRSARHSTTGTLRVEAHDCTLYNVEIAGGFGTRLGQTSSGDEHSWCIYVTGSNTFMTNCVAEVGHGGIYFAADSQQNRVQNTRSDLNSRQGWLIEGSRSQFSNCIALNCGLAGRKDGTAWPGWSVAAARHNTFSNCRHHHESYDGYVTYGFEETGEEPGKQGNEASNNFIGCTSLGHQVAPFSTKTAGPLHGPNRHYVAEWLSPSDEIDVTNIGVLEMRNIAPLSIRNFKGSEGQRLVLVRAADNGAVSILNGDSIRTKTSANFEIAVGTVHEFINIRNVWYQLS